jgi:hypothetical protein
MISSPVPVHATATSFRIHQGRIHLDGRVIKTQLGAAAGVEATVVFERPRRLRNCFERAGASLEEFEC